MIVEVDELVPSSVPVIRGRYLFHASRVSFFRDPGEDVSVTGLGMTPTAEDLSL